MARSAGAPRQAGRELTEALERAIEATRLPLHRPAGRSRARIAMAAPLPVGMDGERELFEIVLTESLPIWRVREALIERLPVGWRLVELQDVWLGTPALAGRINGAVYRLIIAAATDPHAVSTAAAELLLERRLPRTRLKGGAPVAYDLRPLLADVGVVDPGPPVVLRVHTRIQPELGTGRPEEVLAALAERLGVSLGIASITRERLILAGDVGSI